MIGLVGLWALVVAGCTPDETGYGDPDDTGVRLEDDMAAGGGAEAPDVSPEGLVGRVFYTALRPLTATEEVAVTFVALPGTFPGADAVEVSVVEGASSTGPVVEGGFVVVVDARLGDDALLTDGARELGTVTLSYDLGDVETPAAPDGDVAEDGQAGALVGTGDGVDVGDGAIPGVSAPYLAYNTTTGVARRVASGQTGVVLSAEAGDVVCVARLDDADRPGTARCAVF